MTELVNPLEAKLLREAFKQTEGLDTEPTAPDVVRCDYADIRQGFDRQQWLYLYAGGDPVATLPISNTVFKKLKRQMLMLGDLHSGHLRPYSGHQKIPGKA